MQTLTIDDHEALHDALRRDLPDLAPDSVVDLPSVDSAVAEIVSRHVTAAIVGLNLMCPAHGGNHCSAESNGCRLPEYLNNQIRLAVAKTTRG